MKKQLTIEEQAYSNIVTFLEGLLDFHPEYFQTGSTRDKDALAQYYFWGRDIDVEDIYLYRKQLLNNDNNIKTKAESALDKFLASHDVKKSAADYKAWL